MCYFQTLSVAYSTNKQTTSSKVYKSAADAIHDLQDGHKILSGGFGLCGIPENLIKAVYDKGSTNLTIVSNNPGTSCVVHCLIILQTIKLIRIAINL